MSDVDKKIIEQLDQIAFEAVSALIFNKAFFRRKDLLNTINSKLSNDIIHREDKDTIIQNAIERIGLVPLYPNQMVNDWSQYTTKNIIRSEREIIEMAKAESDFDIYGTDEDEVKRLVNKAFESRPTITEEQKRVVIASCLTKKNVVITEGAAGAGKSFSLSAIKEVYENMPKDKDGNPGCDIIGTALSWTATKVLEEAAEISGGMAIAGFIKKMEGASARGKDFFTRRTLIIVDEAGLASTDLIYKILYYAKISNKSVRVILTGDSLQLNPVQAGNALELLVEECGSTRLDTIRRQKQDSHRQAVKHFCFGRAENALYTYHQQESIHFLKDRDDVFEKVVGDYVSYTSAFPDKTALVLALKNDDVATLNKKIRKTLKAVGRVEYKGVKIKAYDGKSVKDVEFCVGDQIAFRKNSPKHPVYRSDFKDSTVALNNIKMNERGGFLDFMRQKINIGSGGIEIRKGIFNRTVGTILDIKNIFGRGYQFRVLLSEGGEVDIKTSEYVYEEHNAVPIMHNFATTIYASQGQTVSRVMMIDDKMMNRKLAYVGSSRHTDLLDVYLDCNELGERIRQRIERERNKARLRLEREQQKNNGSLLAEVENTRLFEQYPELGASHKFTEKEYLGVVASSWNTPSLNQTVTMARKQRGGRMKRDRHWKSPLAPWFLSVSKAKEDNIDDYPDKPYPILRPTVARVKDYHESGTLSKLFGKSSTRPILSQAEAPIFLDDIGISEKNADLDGVPLEYLNRVKGDMWQINKSGEGRVLAFDSHKQVRGRYTVDGDKVIGDGEIPVFENKDGTRNTPFLVVQSFREALIAHSYYRNKFGEAENVPHIVCALKGANIETFKDWINEKSRIFIAHGKREGSLERAQKLGKDFNNMGLCFEYRPKIKEENKNSDTIRVRNRL